MTTPAEWQRILALAKATAETAHQYQRYGEHPYTYHLQRVANGVEGRFMKSVAWLHDVVKDGHLGWEELGVNFPAKVTEAVRAVTQQHYEEYNDYIIRVSQHYVGRQVKMADLRANLAADPKPKLKARYRAALEYLKRNGR